MRQTLKVMTVIGFLTATPQPAPSQTIALLDYPLREDATAPYRYVNPDAPRSGNLHLCYIRMTGFTLGDLVRPAGIDRRPDDRWARLMFDPLLERVPYRHAMFRPLIAKSVTRSDTGTRVRVEIDERARFSDGSPISAQDVIISFKLAAVFDQALKPLADAVEMRADAALGGLEVEMDSADLWRDLLVAFSEVPVIPALTRDLIVKGFEDSIPSGISVSGAYDLTEHNPQRTMSLRRRDDYWARDLPLRSGLDNFDGILLEYYRDVTARRQALLAGQCDLLYEDSGWEQLHFKVSVPEKMQNDLMFVDGNAMPAEDIEALVFNTRSGALNDHALRLAVLKAIESAYVEVKPQGLNIRSLHAFPHTLEAIREAAGIDVEERWRALYETLTKTSSTILQDAGYSLEEGRLLDPDGAPVEITMVLPSWPLLRDFEPILQGLGIATTVEVLEPDAYWAAMRERRFDAAYFRYPPASRYPSEETLRQLYMPQGTYNLPLIDLPGIELLVRAAATTTDEYDFETALRAIDLLARLEAPYVLFHYRKKSHVSARADLRWAGKPFLPSWHLLDFRAWWRGGEWME